MRRPWTESDIPDQRGRVALVTGANSGLGYETARALAAKGATVLLGCRDPVRAEEARGRIAACVPGASLQVVALDLADLASVRRAADEVGARGARLDLLINNAGVMVPPLRRTADGFEVQLGTNHLGHFALTLRLLPLLGATPGSRVVTVTSLMHRFGRIDFDDLDAARSYARWRRYGQSKVANLLFTHELQLRFTRAGAACMALSSHPGAAATELGREFGALGARVMGSFRGTYQSPAMGALPTLRAATDPAAVGGACYGPSGFGELRGSPVPVATSAYSHREDIAARLWAESARLTGEDADPPTLRPRGSRRAAP
ncbi:MAG: oxidoreductase [Polyangiales bacterium]